MGKGKKQRDRHRAPSSGQPGNHSPREAPIKSGPVKAEDSPTVSPEENFFTSRYSNRKITSNWDRYAEVTSSKADDSESAQRLTQLLEQSVLLASRSSFQPSLDALSEAGAEDGYGSAFAIDCDYLVAALADIPVSEKLSIDPIFCQGLDGTSCRHNATNCSSFNNSQDTVFMNAKNQMAELTVNSITTGSDSGAVVSAGDMLTKTSLRQSTPRHEVKTGLDKRAHLTPSTMEDEGELLTKLLAVSTTSSSEVTTKQDGTGHHSDHVESGPPAADSHDDEMDQMLEELLAS